MQIRFMSGVAVRLFLTKQKPPSQGALNSGANATEKEVTVTDKSVSQGKKDRAQVREYLAAKTEAKYISNYAAGSPEWLAVREAGVGGSEVASVMGLSKWQSAYTLWAKKTGRETESITYSEPMEWGNRLEPVIIDKFADDHPEFKVLRGIGTWHHPERPWQIGNPDAIFEREDGSMGIVEVKTAQYEEDWVDGVPRYYETQVQWYLQVFGFDTAYVAALFHGNKYREFEVPANEFVQTMNLDAVESFRKYVLEDKAPDFDGATSTLETVRKMNPYIDSSSEVELGDLGVHYFAAAVDADEANAKKREMASRVLDAMGKARRGLVDGKWVLSRQSRGEGVPYLLQKKG